MQRGRDLRDDGAAVEAGADADAAEGRVGGVDGRLGGGMEAAQREARDACRVVRRLPRKRHSYGSRYPRCCRSLDVCNINFSISIHDDRRTLGRRRQSVDCSCWPIFSPLLPMLVVATKVHLVCEQVRDSEVGVANGFHLEVGGNQTTRLRGCAQE